MTATETRPVVIPGATLQGDGASRAEVGSPPARSGRTAFWAIVVAVALVRLVVVLASHDNPSGEAAEVANDVPTYLNPARALLDDGDFDRAQDSSTPEFVRTPGYPLFVATVFGISGESSRALVAVQAVLSAAGVLLAMLIARRLTGSLAVSVAVGLLLALDPLQTAVTGWMVTEPVAVILTTLLAYCGVRCVRSGFASRWVLASAAALVAATYVRPTTYYLTVVIALVLAAVLVVNAVGGRRAGQARFLAGAALFLFPCGVLLGGWNLRNHSQVGSWSYSGIEGVNLYWYRAADIVARRDGVDFETARLELTEELNRGAVADFDYSEHSHGTLPPAWEDRQGAYYDRAHGEGREIILSEPILAVRQFVRGVYSQLVQSGWGDAIEQFTDRSAPRPAVAGSLLIVWGTEGLAIVGMATALRAGTRADKLAHLVLIGLLTYVIAASAGPEAAAGFRFRAPIWPIWCIYAAIGARHLWRWVEPAVQNCHRH